jgi:Leucine-rich repeat (LRR) protein
MADNNKIVEVGGDLLAGKTNLKTVSLSGNGLTHVDNLFGDVSIYLKVINL